MNSLDKERVDVGFSHNTFSSFKNLNGSTGFCHSHTLTKDIWGREVGDLGVKRYDNSCGDKMDKSQNLQSILERENNLRPSIFQSSPESGALSGGGSSFSGYMNIDQSQDMRIVPDDINRSPYKVPISFH